mgnify:CR=1 FL=1
MMLAFKMLEKVMEREDRVSRMAVENILKLAIPFNAPHRFHIVKLEKTEVQIELPNFKLNHNHVKGIHACAIATLGEFCAGLTLARNLGLSRYRLILAELEVKYHLQGRTTLTGKAKLSPEKLDALKTQLGSTEKVLFEHHTAVENAHGERVADVRTVWQLKDWNKVQLK